MNAQSPKHIVSLVMNGVAGDSRVLKTARAAEAAGYSATIVGLGLGISEPQALQIEGVNVILAPSSLPELQREHLWPKDKDQRQLWLYVEGALRAMMPVVADLKPDLLHSHDMSGLRIGAAIVNALAAQGRHVPWVHDIHEYVVGLTTVPDNYRLSSAEYERRYLRQADHLLTVSDRLAHELHDFYKLRRSATVIYNAPSRPEPAGDNADHIKAVLGLREDQPLVVYIGVAKKERGCETIVSAVASLPNTHLCFVSDSAYVASLKKQAESLGMAARFHVHPYVPSDRVVSFIRSADVGTHGLIHYPNGEVAMPNKMFEYLQADVPMVVSDVAAMKQFVETHKVGRVFEAGNEISCAEAIHSVIRDRRRYRANVTEALKDEYSWDAQALKLRAIYDGALAGNGGGREIFLSSGSDAAERIFETLSRNGAAVALGCVSRDEPRSQCDFYFDPGAAGDRAGVLSRLARRFDVFHVCASLAWPSQIDLMALQAAGKVVNVWRDDVDGAVGSLEPQRAPAAASGSASWSMLGALEAAHLEADRVANALTYERGIALAKLAIHQQSGNPESEIALKAAAKKIARMKATIREQQQALELYLPAAAPSL